VTPLMHDTPGELGQPFDVKDWKKGDCELIPGKTAPQIAVIERDYPNVYKRFTALGPLMNKLGNGGKGIGWNTQIEVRQLGELNGFVTADGASCGMPRIETDIDACDVGLMLAPETNGRGRVGRSQGSTTRDGRRHAVAPRSAMRSSLADRARLDFGPFGFMISSTRMGIDFEPSALALKIASSSSATSLIMSPRTTQRRKSER
jgi:nitrate reductase alpha subunit